ncbi:MAG: hypothetical protein AB7P21_12840 [Lautropia sp.]
MQAPAPTRRHARRRALATATAAVGAVAALAVAALHVAGTPAFAVDPPAKVDCSKYKGTEREACEKMMRKKKQ